MTLRNASQQATASMALPIDDIAGFLPTACAAAMSGCAPTAGVAGIARTKTSITIKTTTTA